MKVLYFVSEEGFSGIHTLCIGMCMRLKKEGFKLGFMKPLGNRYFKEEDLVTDGDAYFLWKTLELEDNIKDICPVLLTPHLVREALSEGRQDYLKKVKVAFGRISEGKDVVVIQGPLTARQGEFLGLSAYKLSRELNVPVILVEKYDDAFFADNVLYAKEVFAQSLLGVIYNIVPPLRQTFLEEFLRPFLENAGIPVLGIIPEDRLLKSVSIRELIRSINGELLCGEEALDKLVEGVIVGAMSQEHAISFFRKRKNHCVVTGGDRSDIQLAALESSAACLVLSGNLYPSPIIIGRADEMGIPVIMVPDDTLSVAEKAEVVIRTARSHEPKKLERIGELLDIYVDMERLYRLSGLR
jgi:hypothetical protein